MKGGKYYEITKLSAKCSAQRLVPDYLGLKKHLKLKGVLIGNGVADWTYDTTPAMIDFAYSANFSIETYFLTFSKSEI